MNSYGIAEPILSDLRDFFCLNLYVIAEPIYLIFSLALLPRPSHLSRARPHPVRVFTRCVCLQVVMNTIVSPHLTPPPRRRRQRLRQRSRSPPCPLQSRRRSRCPQQCRRQGPRCQRWQRWLGNPTVAALCQEERIIHRLSSD